jgi:hypothetical protein
MWLVRTFWYQWTWLIMVIRHCGMRESLTLDMFKSFSFDINNILQSWLLRMSLLVFSLSHLLWPPLEWFRMYLLQHLSQNHID